MLSPSTRATDSPPMKPAPTRNASAMLRGEVHHHIVTVQQVRVGVEDVQVLEVQPQILRCEVRHRAGQVHTLSSGTSLTNLELVQQLERVTGFHGDPVRFVSDSPPATTADTGWIRDPPSGGSGFRTRIDLAEGLKQTVRWYRDNPDWWTLLLVP